MLLWKRKGTWLALPGGRVKREAARPGVGCKSQLVVASEWAIRECASVPTYDAGEEIGYKRRTERTIDDICKLAFRTPRRGDYFVGGRKKPNRDEWKMPIAGLVPASSH
ncbi:hypothetical protein OIU79_026420 [Salix purpurea]|uniref:Uncharacterized protein n=1 Tax=Salix purpurea TaxID=77065 RepID=A0A9Q1A0J0_SALPP|nr:hypothetical protein OIU79_026420 [Salix purpurea]